ncbi:uncharacterized protein LOC105762087 [Gossypium raimondii]|uniref:uncharacterized protein LOC105762087 n=1 Tax=Gossypium raimondii TaxID=29730 RepID=UPI00063AD30D|nr:uncharacterized protein LOC105762087 [Gossypium raimondii]
MLVVNASTNGALKSKSYNEAYAIIKRIASNIYQWPTNQATSERRVTEVHEVDALTLLSAQNKFPPKLKDPGSFIMPCNIGESYSGKALCDLVSSINLMPTSECKRLGIGKAKRTTITLQLVDQSLAYPKGNIEDVLVHVAKFIFPADFIILDFEADK